MSTITETAYGVAVDRNLVTEEAERLDRLYPGWEGKIDILKLNLHSEENCVLGQAMGNFEDGLVRMTEDGYDHRGVYAQNTRFKDFWVDEIRRRLSQ